MNALTRLKTVSIAVLLVLVATTLVPAAEPPSPNGDRPPATKELTTKETDDHAATTQAAATPEAAVPVGPGPAYSAAIPPVGPGPALVPDGSPPRIGFYYILIPGYGYRIMSVDFWSPAAQLGLLRGDIVLSLNGIPLTHYGADIPARAMAVANGGWITAHVRDVRTGLMSTRSTNLFGPNGMPGGPTVVPGGSAPVSPNSVPPAATDATIPPAQSPAPPAGEKPPADNGKRMLPTPEKEPPRAEDGSTPSKDDRPSLLPPEVPKQ